MQMTHGLTLLQLMFHLFLNSFIVACHIEYMYPFNAMTVVVCE